jgi:hypothetical protein
MPATDGNSTRVGERRSDPPALLMLELDDAMDTVAST